MVERPEDINLPLSVVTRIVKDALPDGVNVSKEARAALAKAASVFVLYATSSAKEKRKRTRTEPRSSKMLVTRSPLATLRWGDDGDVDAGDEDAS
ncbi:hypothetical protein MRX96_041351 [Rhipicephalus microplus]